MIEGFLIGVIVCGSAVAGLFFVRFWQRTHDLLFLAFGLSFLIEAANRVRFLFLEVPAEGAASIYLVRLLSYLLIVAAIVHRNLRAPKT